MDFRLPTSGRPLLFLFVAWSATACGGNVVANSSDVQYDAGFDANPCEAGEYYYSDKMFGSTEVGDLKCYRRCESAADCTGTAAPFCSEIGLFNGGDYNCNATMRVCRQKDTDDCP